MLISEFVERTGITPNADEWDSINEVYNNADCDKDEFCALWCKMNAKRVEKAKEVKKVAEKEAQHIEWLWNIVKKALKDYENAYDTKAEDWLMARQKRACEYFGIKYQNASIADIKYRVADFICKKNAYKISTTPVF